jgi:dCMP deaminase
VPSGERHELCRGLHAEQNAIIQAAKHGTNISGSVLFCTNTPCVICSKMIINAGIRRVVFLEGYPDRLSLDMLAESGIEVHKLEDLLKGKEASPS